MIEIITGNNRGACLEYISSRSSDLIKEGRTLSRFSSIDETNDEIILNELLGQDLFTTKKVYILSDILLAPRVIEVLETQCDKFNDKYILWHEDAIPAQIIKNMEKTEKDNSAAARELINNGWKFAVLKLYREGKISTGKAAKELNISVSEFIDLLKEFGINSPIEYEDFLESEKTMKKVWE